MRTQPKIPKRVTVGPMHPFGPSRRATYTGPILKLRGQRALVYTLSDGTEIAQFNEFDLVHKKRTLAFGWWPFSLGSFTYDLAEPTD